MSIYAGKKRKGFTLVEVLLVIVIIAMVLYASGSYMQQQTLKEKIDRTSTQMQQILNAGLTYYLMNGSWPTSMACLEGEAGCSVTYLPASLQSPWGTTYDVLSSTALASSPTSTPSPSTSVSAGNNFFVYTTVVSSNASGSAAAIAQTIAGTLPLSYTSSAAPTTGAPPSAASSCTAASKTCYVVAAVNIPGQNLNNATAANYAGMYRNGGCVPVPQCPLDIVFGNSTFLVVPQIFVVPVSVSGLYDPGNTKNIYPISSFTAYALGGTNSTPAACTQSSSGSGGAPACVASESPTGNFWRACLQIYTEKGEVTSPNGASNWGEEVSLLAFTRCSVYNEPAGSPFTVYQ